MKAITSDLPSKVMTFWIPEAGRRMKRRFEQIPTAEQLKTAQMRTLVTEPYNLHLQEEGRVIQATSISMVLLDGEDVDKLLDKMGLRLRK